MKGERGVPVRLRFTKRGRVRFISHRDVARAFERAFRIARVPLAFTEGFSPHPRISFGLALPTGTESDAEYLDVELTDETDLDRFAAAVTEALPEGMDVTGVEFLEARATSLQQGVTSISYHVEAFFSDDGAWSPSDVEAWVQDVLAADALVAPLRRKGREVTDDLRPAISALIIEGPEAGSPPANPPSHDATAIDTRATCVNVKLELSTQPRNVRPEEVLALVGPGCLSARKVLRIEQWIERDGSRLTPLEADTRPRAEVGAR